MYTSIIALTTAAAGLANAVALEPRAPAPKINEYSEPNCKGNLLYHHSPPVFECVGIDAATQSVYVVHGLGESDALFWTSAGTCDNHSGGFSGTGGSTAHDNDDVNCYSVGSGAGRVRDINFAGT